MKNMSLKKQRGHQPRKKKREKKMWDNRENSARERSVEFGGGNNAPAAISLISTVGSCWYLDILFFSHYTTNILERFQCTQLFWQQSSLESSWKIKGNTPAGQFWSPVDFAIFHRWIMFIFGYVVHLDVSLIIDDGDQKQNLQKGCVYV